MCLAKCQTCIFVLLRCPGDRYHRSTCKALPQRVEDHVIEACYFKDVICDHGRSVAGGTWDAGRPDVAPEVQRIQEIAQRPFVHLHVTLIRSSWRLASSSASAQQHSLFSCDKCCAYYMYKIKQRHSQRKAHQ